ncbi:MAG: hypothetical protein L6U61_10615 [Bacteroidales bacterium]|nr:MAG: hypothetical protein L6U61_10615 [Bacteroidales bacterium]
MEQWDDVLPVGSVLRSGKREYRVEAVLGKGGFGITYKVSAMEQVGQIPVRVEFAMKEFHGRMSARCFWKGQHG